MLEVEESEEEEDDDEETKVKEKIEALWVWVEENWSIVSIPTVIEHVALVWEEIIPLVRTSKIFLFL